MGARHLIGEPSLVFGPSSEDRVTAVLKERRGEQRINAGLTAFIGNATGILRDVSASGAFFWINGTHALGESVSFSMGLQTWDGEFLVRGKGVVVRTEWHGNTVGVAVRLTKTEIKRIKT